MLFGSQKPPKGLLDGLQGQLSQAPMGMQDMTPQRTMQSMAQPFAQGMVGAAQTVAQPIPQHHGVNWGGVITDFAAGLAGREGPYLAAMQAKQQQEDAARAAAAQRAASMQDWRTKFDYEQSHKVEAPNAFDQAALGAGLKPGTPEWTDAHVKYLQHFNDPIVNATLPGDRFYSGPQSGMGAAIGAFSGQGSHLDAIPTVEDGYSYTPGPGGRANQSNWKAVGGGVGNGPGGFRYP